MWNLLRGCLQISKTLFQSVIYGSMENAKLSPLLPRIFPDHVWTFNPWFNGKCETFLPAAFKLPEPCYKRQYMTNVSNDKCEGCFPAALHISEPCFKFRSMVQWQMWSLPPGCLQTSRTVFRLSLYGLITNVKLSSLLPCRFPNLVRTFNPWFDGKCEAFLPAAFKLP